MPLESLTVRVDDLVRRVNQIDDELRSNRPAVLANQIAELSKDTIELSGEVKGLRRATIAFAFTVAASAVGFAITVLLVWGGHA